MRKVRYIYLLTVALLVLINSSDVTSAAENKTEADSPQGNENRQSSKPIRDKWAVVVGIDRFKDKTIPPLQYASKDARDFARFLVEKGNFAKDHVNLILNEKATERNILNVLGDKWLPRRAMPDDLIVIFVSSHGSPRELDRRGANYLIAHDTLKDELYTSGIKLEDLGPDIQGRTMCNRVVLILDACNSGAAKAGGKGLYRSKNFDVKAISERAGKGLVVISSSDANQRSWESKRYKNSVFTKCLIDTLDNPQESKRIERVFDGVKDRVEQEVKFDRQVMQTPVMSSKWEGIPLKLTCKPSKPRSVQDLPDERLKPAPSAAVGRVVAKPAAGSTTAPAVSAVSIPESARPVKVALVPTADRVPPATPTDAEKAVVRTSSKSEGPRQNPEKTAGLKRRIAIVGVFPANKFAIKATAKRPRLRQRKRQRARQRFNNRLANRSQRPDPKVVLPNALREALGRKLFSRTGVQVVDHNAVSIHRSRIFGQKKPKFFFPEKNKMKLLAQSVNSKYLIMVQVAQMHINENPSFGPQVNIQITTKVIDGDSGRQVATFKERAVRPPSRKPIKIQAVLQYLIPSLADEITKDVARKFFS